MLYICEHSARFTDTCFTFCEATFFSSSALSMDAQFLYGVSVQGSGDSALSGRMVYLGSTSFLARADVRSQVPAPAELFGKGLSFHGT